MSDEERAVIEAAVQLVNWSGDEKCPANLDEATWLSEGDMRLYNELVDAVTKAGR